MTTKLFTAFILLFAFCFLLSCDDLTGSPAASTDGSAEDEELKRLSPEERRLIVTNPLIEGIADGKPIEDLEEDISWLFEPNLLGNTGFGETIRFRSEEDALKLLPRHNCQKLYHTNDEGESFVYLASKRGFSTLIKSMADICYESQGEWLDGEDYEFYNLDSETKTGDKALHVAANVPVAEALVYEYEERGMEASPISGWSFYDHTNQDGRTFLHTAAADGRVDIIKWAVKRECDKNSLENEGGFWGELMSFGKALWMNAQTNSWNITNLITQQDNNDDTAFHLAASTLNKDSIHALANCRWANYSLTNLNEDIPLQVFLKTLDPSQASHEEDVKRALRFLIHSETVHIDWRRSPSSLVDHQNKDLNSSLHLAAGLADPFFYEYLKQFGNTTLKNNKGNTPEQIFESTHNKPKTNTQPTEVI